MTELSDRLGAVRTRGNLTISDLQRWFGRTYATVRNWTLGHGEPASWEGRNQQGRVYRRLEELETLVDSSVEFPIPSELKPQDHADYFRRIIDANGGGVPDKHTA
jgi:hypothetical protein